MRRSVLLFFLVLIAGTCFSQKTGQERVDSLMALLPQATTDPARIDLYVQLMAAYNTFDRVEGIKLEKPAMALALKMGSKYAEGEVKNAVGRIHWRDGRFDQALMYHEQAQQIFEELGDPSKIVLCWRYIGQDYADAGNYPEALKQFTKALAAYKELDDKENMGYVHELLAWVYAKQGNYAEMAQNGYAAISIFEALGNQKNVALVTADVAEYYLQLGYYEEALKYFQKSVTINQAKGDRINLGYNYNMFGKVYLLTGKNTEALTNYKKAVEVGKEIDDRNIMAIAYSGMADVYQKKKDFAQSLSYYEKALNLFRGTSNKKNLAHTYCKIGNYYRMEKQYARSKIYYDSAFSLSYELESRSLRADYFAGLEKLDSAMGNWQGAYVNFKKHQQLKDSSLNQGDVKKMIQFQLQYEFDKKEAAVKAQQEEKELRLQKQFTFMTIIAVLVCILAIVLYTNQKRMASINKELEQKSASLEEENREKTSILNIVSHDLKAPFNKIKGLIDLIQMSDNLSTTERDEYIAYIRSSIDQGTYLISKLLEAQSVYDETNQPIFEPIDMLKFIADFERSTSGQLLKKGQHLQKSVQLKHTMLRLDQQMVTRILDNLVSNASKFSEPGKNIYLNVWSDDKNLFFSVRDEGPGISEPDQQNMFRRFHKLTARPTAGEGSTGLGLSITKTIIDKLNGSISINSKLKEGTEIQVGLPIQPV